jgi:excisionase family DNA binding protein
MSINIKEELWTARDIARWSKLDVQTIYRKVERKEIPFIKVGNAIRFVPSEIERWVRKNK